MLFAFKIEGLPVLVPAPAAEAGCAAILHQQPNHQPTNQITNQPTNGRGGAGRVV
jgi:hypothetical protein